MERKPAVAGMFYDDNREELLRSIQECFMGSLGPGKLPEVSPERKGNVLGLVCPHAGYIYSGSAAAYSYSKLASDGLPEVAVLLGPNHYGIGSAIALTSAGQWSTPLGTVDVDRDTISELLKTSKYASISDAAHQKEHSLEVQVPFLQFIGGSKIKIIPISIAHANLTDALELVQDLSAGLAEALKGKSAVIIASTDFTHYENQATASIKDSKAIEQILKLDGEGLLYTVEKNSISMCGAVGTAVMLETCKALGAKQAEKLTYYTSGDVIGDTDQVVGYAAISVLKN